MSDRTPELAIAFVLAVLVAGALLLGDGGGSGRGEDGTAAQESVSPQRLARVERRVERLRGLRFRRPVRVELLTPAQVRRFGVAETTRERTLASQEVLKLLGLIAADVDLDAVTASIYGEQVAGFYDPRSERLALVRGVGIDDVTLAHELTHALEDQHFDLERLGDPDAEGRGVASDEDRSSAESGLVEGSATALMTDYLRRYPDALTFGDALGQLMGAAGGTPLPPYVMRSLLFPYDAGADFVGRLRATSGDWRLVDNALRDRPPVSTAELLDVERWLRVRRPAPLALPATATLGAGWRPLADSTLGEDDLRELLRVGVGEDAAKTLSSGWEGGRYALWRRGPLPAAGCREPCLERDAFALRLRLETPADARAVAAALGVWLREARDARPAAAAGAWSLPGGTTAALAARTREVRLALAPTQPLADALLR